jgi:hypothetical protein
LLTLTTGLAIETGTPVASMPGLVVATADAVARAFFVARAAGLVLAREERLSDESRMDDAQPVLAPSGARHVVFTNHPHRGRWDVYVHPWPSTLATSFDPQVLVAVSGGGTENIGPRAAFRGAELGIAYRRDRALAFARVQGRMVLSETVGAEELPHPTLDRVLPLPAGYAVIYHRAESRAAFFDAAGLGAGDLALGGFPADGFMHAGSVRFLVARGDRLVLVHPDRTPPTELAGGPRAAVGSVRVSSSEGSDPLVAWTEGSADEATLAVAWLRGGALVPVANRVIAPLNSPALELGVVDGGPVVIYTERDGDRRALRVLDVCP